MSEVITEVLVDRPVGEVFAFVTDPTNDPKWWRGVRHVRVLADTATPGSAGTAQAAAGTPSDPVRAGTEYEQVTQLFGRRFSARLKVVAYHPPRQAVLVTVRSATPFTAVYTFEPVAAGRTRFRMTATVTPAGVYRLLGPLFVPLIRAQTRHYFRVLKAVLEGRRDA